LAELYVENENESEIALLDYFRKNGKPVKRTFGKGPFCKADIAPREITDLKGVFAHDLLFHAGVQGNLNADRIEVFYKRGMACVYPAQMLLKSPYKKVSK